MKKLVSLALSLLMIVAFSVSAFAATREGIIANIDANKDVFGISAADIATAKDVVNKMSDAAVAAIDGNKVFAVVKANEEAIKAGTVNVEKLQKDINAVLPADVQVSVSSVSVSGSKLSLNVSVALGASATKEGKAITTTVSVTNNGTEAPAATNPVKATGSDVNVTSLAVLGIAMAACIGAAVVCTRKLGLAE